MRARLDAESLLLVSTLLLASCGGSGDAAAGNDGADAPESEATAPRATPDASPAAAAEASTAPAPPVPIVHFAAYGPAPSTWGPGCATGLEVSPSDVFRVRVPEEWTYRSSSGGSGIHTLGFDTGDGRVLLDMFVSLDRLQLADDLEVVGETGTTVDIAGTSFPLSEISIDGRHGFGIMEIPYIDGLPRTGPMTGAFLISSANPEAVDAALAVRILGTVRVERCGAISRLLVMGPANGIQAVPEFEGGDPLGKERPDEPSPEFVPGKSPLLVWSEAQVAYMLPLPEAQARCVAPLVRADAADDPILHFRVLVPNGTHKELLADYVARC